MAREYEITFKPNPIQRQFIESRATADLFSSRMGEGKSVGIGWAAFYHTRHNPGARWAIIRDTWENLQGTTMKSFFEWFPPGVMGTYVAQRKTFTWAEGVAKGEVEFLGMDDPQDATKLMSRELAGFAIDEPAPAVGSTGVSETIFDIAMTRLRQPNMKWYGAKLAENNPDEAHWTYKRFVQPGEEGFLVWQPSTPENMANLPPGYYETLRKTLRHRPDLVRRFVEGEFGFQQEGKAVTPQWNDKLHLTTGLYPMPGQECALLWDFGHNPTCIITQRTPMGYWLILDSFVGEDMGVDELIHDVVKPTLVERYKAFRWRHIGDPAGETREQTSYARSAVRTIKKELGGPWRSGPIKWHERRDPLQAVLSRTIRGTGVVQVDRHRAKEVWHALRGGYHYHVARTGIISGLPKKNIHSHPGDAMGYGAALLYPLGRLTKQEADAIKMPQRASYFSRGPQLGFERPGALIPPEGRRMGD